MPEPKVPGEAPHPAIDPVPAQPRDPVPDRPIDPMPDQPADPNAPLPLEAPGDSQPQSEH